MTDPKQQDLLKDLALTFATEFQIKAAPLPLAAGASGGRLDLTYEIDGTRIRRSFLSRAYCRALLLFNLAGGKELIVQKVHGVDENHWFSKRLIDRLAWFARPDANFVPAARLYDPDGTAELLLTRSRLRGHAVDALHNLNGAGPVFQPLLVLDLLALEPKFGIKLVWDHHFTPTASIGTYLQASAKARKIDDGSGSQNEEAGDPSFVFNAPSAGPATRAMFRQVREELGIPDEYMTRTITDDYCLVPT